MSQPIHGCAATTTTLLDRLRDAAPPGMRHLNRRALDRLCALTAELVDARSTSGNEFHRFMSVQHRSISLPEPQVSEEIAGQTVIVTGGSGCIGTQLLRLLADFRPAKLISLAITPPRQAVPGVEYLTADVRSQQTLRGIFQAYRPDIVFHLAAQRDPGLAERQVIQTLSTNVIGTGTIAAVAAQFGVRRLVYASTGKAVRPYTADIYAGSKRIGEWLMAEMAATSGTTYSGVRFTHVVDNSIIMERLRRWCADGEVVRLHAADIMFYVQSAIESAQLMLTALLAPREDTFRLHVIRDLSWPISLLDLALGVMTADRRIAPLYIVGPEPGYEANAYPGLYDPLAAGDLSPLVNALESPSVEPSASADVDAFTVGRLPSWELHASLGELRRACAAGDVDAARGAHLRANRQLLVETAATTPPERLRRVARLTEPHRPSMTEEHLLIDDAFRDALSMAAVAA